MRRLVPIFLALALPAFAVDWKSDYKLRGYVSDFANVVDSQSAAELQSYAARVEQATGAQFVFVTIPSLQGEPIENVANDIFHSAGVGEKGKDNGLMVLLSIRDHKSRLEVGGGLGEYIPDSMAGLLLDDMRPALREKEYGTALLMAAQRLGSTLAQAKGVQIPPPSVPHRVERRTHDRIPWPLIMIGIFILLALLRRGGGGYYGGGGGGGFWTGLLLSQMLNSGRRGYSGGGGDGGGFGGFDSGGSSGGFGGFGGGDSGGGGASSDW